MSKIEFLATIPPLQSALNIDGSGGGRIKLDIPESDINAVYAMGAMRGKVLKVAIEIEDEYSQKTGSGGQTQKRRWPSDEADA